MNIALLYLLLLKGTCTAFAGLASLPVIHDTGGQGAPHHSSPINGSPPVVASAQPDLKTVVTFNSDMAISKDAIDRLKTLNEKSKKCGERTGYFSVALDSESLVPESGSPTYGYDWGAYGYPWVMQNTEWRNRVHSELVRAMNEAGIPRDKVMVDSLGQSARF